VSAAAESAEASHGAPVTVLDLFLNFCRVGVSGFGGVLPWARRMLVEERHWLTEEEFVNLLSLCQFLPGGNVMNLAVCVGARFGGALGSVAALSGLMVMPVVIVLCLATLYAEFSEVPTVEAMFRGLSSAAAGLVVATGIKMMLSLRKSPRALAFVALTIIAMAVLKVPLLLIVLTLLPLSFAALTVLRR
jgi:chromate transporter